MIIKGFEQYQITTDGNIFKDKKILKNYVNKSGYSVVYLYKSGKRYFRQVHRLVAETFLENKENKLQVNHKDGVKTNNHLDNLEWCTPSENCRHSIDILNRNISKGDDHGMSKLKQTDIVNIYKLQNNGLNYVEISKIYSVTPELIGMIINKKIWKHVQGGIKKEKYVCRYDDKGLLLNTFKSQQEAARSLGFSQSLINRALQGKCNMAYGFIWKYI